MAISSAKKHILSIKWTECHLVHLRELTLALMDDLSTATYGRLIDCAARKAGPVTILASICKSDGETAVAGPEPCCRGWPRKARKKAFRYTPESLL